MARKGISAPGQFCAPYDDYSSNSVTKLSSSVRLRGVRSNLRRNVCPLVADILHLTSQHSKKIIFKHALLCTRKVSLFMFLRQLWTCVLRINE